MKGLLVLSHDVEDIEALGTRALLVRAGFEITTTTFQKDLSVTTAFGLQVKCDSHLDDIKLDEFDFLMIPGGKYVRETIDLHDKMQVLAKEFSSHKKLIAAICAGPRFLGRAGLLDDVHYTAFPGSEFDMPKGIYAPNEKALRDGLFITARGAGAVYEFVYEIVKYFYDEDKAKALMESIRF
jgi:protein deglycase